MFYQKHKHIEGIVMLDIQAHVESELLCLSCACPMKQGVAGLGKGMRRGQHTSIREYVLSDTRIPHKP